MNKIRITEFAGITGCGKSTLAKRMISKYSNEARVYTYTDVVKLAYGPYKRYYEKLARLNPSRWSYYSKLDLFAHEYSNVSETAICVLTCLYDISAHISFFNPNALFILEEGFVQTLTSIPHLEEIIIDSALIDLADTIKEKFDLTVINCRCSTETAITRLRNRNTPDRFNIIKDDAELGAALRIKQQNLDSVIGIFESVVAIDMERGENEIYEELLRNNAIL